MAQLNQENHYRSFLHDDMSKMKVDDSYVEIKAEDMDEKVKVEDVFEEPRPAIIRAVGHLHQYAKATRIFTSQVPVPRSEIYPGRHLVRRKVIREPLMEKLRAIALKKVKREAREDEEEGKCPFETMSQESDCMELGVNDCNVRIQTLKHYPDPEKQMLERWGHIVPLTKVRYIRHIRLMHQHRLLTIQGRTRRRRIRRDWVVSFDQLEPMFNRVVFGRSILQSVLGHLKFTDVSNVLMQAWSDYQECDFSDFFTLARLFTFLSEAQLDAIPAFVIVHDYVQYKTPVPPGLAGTFDTIFEESVSRELTPYEAM